MSYQKISENKKDIQITREDLPEIFEIIDNQIYLKNSKAFPFKINFPLDLNEEIAKISAMILDGSLSKDLNGCMFSQKKDKGKVTEFFDIIQRLFDLNGVVSLREDTGTYVVDYHRKAFASFLYYCLGIHKSDEPAKIPIWVWKSPKSVIREYLRYAFAMEGSISHYLKATEIKFHSVDLPYLKDLKRLLKDKFEINSEIQKYHIKRYGWKYYLYFSSRNEINKFNQIGFALESHQRRLEEVISNFKNKAWEITLVNILKLNKKIFSLSDINKIFPYLCKRAIHHRLTYLVEIGYSQKEKQGYSLTNRGLKIALSLKDKIKTTKLRTNPKENEEGVIQFLNLKGKSYRNEIARELKINPLTVCDTLKRLTKRGRIKFVGADKFQRKFYKIKK